MNRLITLIILCSVALMSCTRKVYVPQETVRTEYRDKVVESLLVDTVSLRDSVAVYVNGDTVKIEKYRDRWRTRIIERHDTTVVVKTDSIRVPVPVPVEKPLTKWQRVKQDFGEFAIAFICVALAVIAWFVFKKRRR